MINYIVYGGKSLRDFNLYVNGRGTYDTPAKVYSMVKIQGRSGDLAFDEKRFENIDITYPAAFIDPSFETNFEELKSYLFSREGYQRLEDTYHPDEYRMGIYKEGLEVEMDMLNMFGTFDLVFHCKPQRFLKSGEIETIVFDRNVNSQPSSLINPTRFDSKPLILVGGNGTIGIGSQSIQITDIYTGYTYIDCEMMDAYRIVSNAKVSANNVVRLSNYDFPVLTPGINNFSVTSDITSMAITPRWWKI